MLYKYLSLIFTLLLIQGISSQTYAQEKNNNLPIDEIKQFVDVYNAIKNEYVEKTPGEELIQSAIEGMLENLDPHSAFYTQSKHKEQSESISGNYQGFGLELETQEGQLIIITPFSDSPAAEAELKSSDIIEKINNTSAFGLTMKEVGELLVPLETVILTISRANQKPFTVQLKKRNISLKSVKHKTFSNISIIQITQFQHSTSEDFTNALNTAIEKKSKGIVLDLRNNPGGLLDVTIDVANQLLTGGLIASTKNLNTNSEEKFHATQKTLAPNIPIIVLINEGSASAAELLAGALQDHNRAVVVGQNSFGKGSVQTIIKLDSGDAVKLTTSKYYTPNGKSIQNDGITPDIYLNQLEIKSSKKELLSYREKDIYGHLKNTNKASKKLLEPNLAAIDLAKKDLMLFEAINSLKTLIFAKEKSL